MKARDKINKLIFEHQNKFGFHSDFDFINEALDEMEQWRDEFAAGFANYILLNGWQRYPKAMNLWVRTLLGGSVEKITSEQLLEEYKKTL